MAVIFHCPPMWFLEQLKNSIGGDPTNSDPDASWFPSFRLFWLSACGAFAKFLGGRRAGVAAETI